MYRIINVIFKDFKDALCIRPYYFWVLWRQYRMKEEKVLQQCFKLYRCNIGGSTHLFWFNQLELHTSASPSNEMRVWRIIKKSYQKLPQLKGTTPLVCGALSIHSWLLLNVTYAKENVGSFISINWIQGWSKFNTNKEKKNRCYCSKREERKGTVHRILICDFGTT